MFTGIVTDIGGIEKIKPVDGGARLRIETQYDPQTITIGASIACNGVCLTVVAVSNSGDNKRWFEVEAWEEALRLTNLQNCREGSKINLERSLKIGDELGGHLVSGHVDGMVQIATMEQEGEARRFQIEAGAQFAPYIAEKGSICLDGTSLTINKVEDKPGGSCLFDVLIIRHTLEVTIWGAYKQGDWLNIEIDQMARYSARLNQFSDNTLSHNNKPDETNNYIELRPLLSPFSGSKS